LQARGIPSPRGNKYWDRTTVWGILRNPAYMGQARFGKTRLGPRRPRLRPLRGQSTQPHRSGSVYDTLPAEQIAIAVPALVDEEMFQAVTAQFQENRRRRRESRKGSRYLLSGLLACAQCGYAYYGKRLYRSGRRVRDYAYYRCTGSDRYRFGGQRI